MTKLKAGKKIKVDEDFEAKTLTIKPIDVNIEAGNLTPEFLNWLKKFNAKYKDVLKELAKKDVVLAIHDSMIEKYGGSHGIRDLGLIQLALVRPQASFAMVMN